MRHGGDLAAAIRDFARPEPEWLDLSTGVNPRPWPARDALSQSAAMLSRLPASDALVELLAAARAAYAVPENVGICAAPGTEILIRLLPLVAPGPAALLRTSYCSYREAWQRADELLVPVVGLDSEESRSARTVVVVNPNNPDGRTIPPDDLIGFSRGGGGRQIVVDEAFADSAPETSVVPKLRPDDDVIVLKSFGKFFGLPGLRLGFAVGAPGLVEQLAALLGDWPVSVAALAVARPALNDRQWQQSARTWQARQSAALAKVLARHGIDDGGRCRLFRLGLIPDAKRLHRRLAEQGVWTRRFDTMSDALRIGLPPDPAGLDRLDEALAAACR